jgi:glycosyltransferase involved in cell wall biosynthesis
MSKEKIRLNWICEAPSHYNDFLFELVACAQALQLEVHYMVASISSHPWKTRPRRDYAHRNYARRLGVDWLLLHRAALSRRPEMFVIGGWFDLTAISVITICALRSLPFAIWTDTPSEKGRRGSVFQFFRRRWIAFVFRHARYVLGTGEKALRVLSSMGCPRAKLLNLPYFTQFELFTPSHDAGDAHGFVFLSSGRLVNSAKGYDIAIRALGRLRRTHPNMRFKYRLAGVGADFEQLKSLAAQEGIDDSVEFLGWLEAKDLPEFYRSGSIFLHPALYEPYGVAVIEAMAAGLAVIGSDDTGAVVDRIVDGKNGYACPSGSVDELFSAVVAATSDEERLAANRREARRTAEQWPVSRGVEIVEKVVLACAASRE